MVIKRSPKCRTNLAIHSAAHLEAQYTPEERKTLVTFGKRFKQLRTPFYTIQEVAERFGAPVSFIQDLEDGKINISCLDLIKLANAIGADDDLGAFFQFEFVEDKK